MKQRKSNLFAINLTIHLLDYSFTGKNNIKLKRESTLPIPWVFACVFLHVNSSVVVSPLSPPVTRRSWRTSRPPRACPQRRRSPSCPASWPWWTSWCSPARSTSARSRRRRTCPAGGWWGSASDLVCVSLSFFILLPHPISSPPPDVQTTSDVRWRL